MGKKRRSDSDFKIGESMPGTKGDSEGTHHDGEKTPMETIHDRREGELLSKEEMEEFVGNTPSQEEKHDDHEPKELDEEEKKARIASKYAEKYRHQRSGKLEEKLKEKRANE